MNNKSVIYKDVLIEFDLRFSNRQVADKPPVGES